MAAQLALEDDPPAPAAPAPTATTEGDGDSWMAKMRSQATAKAQARVSVSGGGGGADEQENRHPDDGGEVSGGAAAGGGGEMDAFERRRAARAAAGAATSKNKDWIKEMKEEAARREEAKVTAAARRETEAEEEEEAMRAAAEEEARAKARQQRVERQKMLATGSAFSRSEMNFNHNAEGGYARRMREAEDAAKIYEQMRRDVEDLERERGGGGGGGGEEGTSWRDEAHQREASQQEGPSSGESSQHEERPAGTQHPRAHAQAQAQAHAPPPPPPPPSGPGAPVPCQAAVGARLEGETRGMDLAGALRHFGHDPGPEPAHDVLRTMYKRAALAMHPDRNQPAVVGAAQAGESEERWKIITNRMDDYLKVLERKAMEAQQRS